ncbi:MAG: thiamine pyrophosphate-dependent enzyme [Oscillospiraceae bacterium]|nr:thiamine pyrophosphate-dependent enzyme [Oscillospiraceae bacterium]
MSSIVYEKSKALTDSEFHYCPGCSHGVIHKLVAESLYELDVYNSSICIASVGCSVLAYNYFNCDCIQAAHGRAPAVATGAKRVSPNKIVFTYQGDGDLAGIGMGEIIHAALRGENITVIFVNNAVYGMTGGQMAPTTLIDQKTTTTPFGRTEIGQGKPIKISELISEVPSSFYVERVSVHDVLNIKKAKRAIKKAFENQVNKKGFSLIEVLSTCNIGWGLSPVEALNYIKDAMIPYYKLGVYKDEGELKRWKD